MMWVYLSNWWNVHVLYAFLGLDLGIYPRSCGRLFPSVSVLGLGEGLETTYLQRPLDLSET